jgi:hypothetical protein
MNDIIVESNHPDGYNRMQEMEVFSQVDEEAPMIIVEKDKRAGMAAEMAK